MVTIWLESWANRMRDGGISAVDRAGRTHRVSAV